MVKISILLIYLAQFITLILANPNFAIIIKSLPKNSLTHRALGEETATLSGGKITYNDSVSHAI